MDPPSLALFRCPVFAAETDFNLKHKCHGNCGKSMSTVRQHLQRKHNIFAKLCLTCNNIIVDPELFLREHGGACNDPHPIKKGAAAQAQYTALCRTIAISKFNEAFGTGG